MYPEMPQSDILNSTFPLGVKESLYTLAISYICKKAKLDRVGMCKPELELH